MNKLKLAFLCDIDNAQVTVEAFNEIMEKFSKSSEIILGKIYGYSDRRHKGFLEVVNASCFEIASTMRYKKRSSQQDIRIIVDAAELAQRDYLDGFIIVGGDGDFAPLLAYLKGRGKFVAGAFKNSENYLYCDEIVELPAEEKEDKPAKKAVAPKAEPVVAASIVRAVESASKAESDMNTAETVAVKAEVKAEPARAESGFAAEPERAVSASASESAPEKSASASESNPEPAKSDELSTADIFSELEKIVKEFASKNK